MSKLVLALGVVASLLGVSPSASGVTLFSTFSSGVLPANGVPLVVGGPGEFVYLQDFVPRVDVHSPVVEIPIAPSASDPSASVTVRLHLGPAFDLDSSVIASMAVAVPVTAAPVQLDFSGVMLTGRQRYGLSVSTNSSEQALWIALPLGQVPFLRSDAGGSFLPIASTDTLGLRVTATAVPEPTTGMLLCLALLAAAALPSRDSLRRSVPHLAP